VGKALTLIGMLATEFVFVFHEGASSYVWRSHDMHRKLADGGLPLTFHPILRVKYTPWDAMDVSCIWLRLPEPLRQPFGGEHICAQSFAKKWRTVAREQEGLLARLGELVRPIDLIRFLDGTVGGAWNRLADEYEELHDILAKLEVDLSALRAERTDLHASVRALRTEKVRAEAAKGEHFRERIFEREPTPADLARREELAHAVEEAVHKEASVKRRLRDLYHQQEVLVADPEIRRVHERRRTLELEAELKRLDLIRDAVIASKGLERASNRPSAWWFPAVDPSGAWFHAVAETATFWWQPLMDGACADPANPLTPDTVLSI
jgi:regulator of replication initiation timing